MTFIILFFSILSLAISVITLVLVYKNLRTKMVNDYRTNLVFRIGEVVKRDAAKATEMTKDELSWRYKEFEKVTFKQMLWKFWKPVESFYNEANLLDEGKN